MNGPTGWSPAVWRLMAAAMAAGAVAGAQAAAPAPSARAQAALETLLQSAGGRAPDGAGTVLAQGAGSGSGALSGSSHRPVVAVERGQALDTIIRRHLAASPLRVEVLRELIKQLNPAAFAAGSGHRLLAGARLQLPTTEDQLRHAFGDRAVASAVGSRKEDTAEPVPGGYGAAAAARKGWVRYP